MGAKAEDEDANVATPSSTGTNIDTLSATQVALRVLQRKYNNRVARFEASQRLPGNSNPEAKNSTPLGINPNPLPPAFMRFDEPAARSALMDEVPVSYYPFWDQAIAQSNQAGSEITQGSGLPLGDFARVGALGGVGDPSSMGQLQELDPNLVGNDDNGLGGQP